LALFSLQKIIGKLLTQADGDQLAYLAFLSRISRVLSKPTERTEISCLFEPQHPRQTERGLSEISQTITHLRMI